MSCSKCYAGKIADIPVAEDAVHTADVEKRIIFAPGKFWNDYVVRHFTVAGKAQTPFHAHDWPHYVLVLAGKCNAKIDDMVYPLESGCWAHVPSNVEHSFTNTGEDPLAFVCIVPREGDSAGNICFS